MALIYVVMRGAREITGEFSMFDTEGAFRTKEQAQAFLAGKPIVWEETINGAECQCERAVHEVELAD